MFNSYYDLKKEVIEAMAAADAGYLSEGEAYKKIKTSYDYIMEKFKKKYGFRPYKVGKLEPRQGTFSKA